MNVPPPPLWLLTLLTFSGTLAMHIFVPALPMAAADLGASQSSIQWTISVYILGLAIGQLFYGPISDGIGRRPALVAGLILYTAAGALCAVATRVDVLVAARWAQALGGCAGLLLGRAIVRDTSDTTSTVRRLATLTLMMLVGPGLAPMIGGAWVSAWGWRSLFAAMCTLGLVNIVLVWRLLPETGRPTRTFSFVDASRDYRRLLRSPRFVGYAVGGGCATTTLYAFLGAAPFIYVHQLGRSLHEAGLIVGLLMLGLAGGNLSARAMAGRVRLETLMIGANVLSVACAVALLAWVLMFGPDLFVSTGLMLLYMAGAGACSPAASTKAMSVDPRLVGSSAGLFGFFQMAVGAASSAMAAIGPDASLASAVVLVVSGLLGLVAFSVARRYDAG